MSPNSNNRALGSKVIPTAITRTSGLFQVPVLQDVDKAELWVYVSNHGNRAASAEIVVNEAASSSKSIMCRTNLLVSSMGTAQHKLNLDDCQGSVIEVTISLTSDMVKPSAAIVQTQSQTKRTLFFLPPSSFSLLKARL